MITPPAIWASPLTAAQAAAAGVGLSFATTRHGRLLWIEARPAEAGRCVPMCRDDDGSLRELGPADLYVRSRVHEYGGLPYAVVGDTLIASRWSDQALVAIPLEGAAPAVGAAALRPLTPPGLRYADGCAVGRTLWAVREDHRGAGEPINAIVALDLDAALVTAAPDGGQVVWADSDFVAYPRVSPDGRRLAFMAWDHPHMPWDSSRLLVGRLTGTTLVDVDTIAGAAGESVLEPRWDADGSLLFLSDRSGWWNLMRWRAGRVETVTALRADLGGPLWQLGMATYAPTGDGRALVRVCRGARDALAVVDLVTGALRELPVDGATFGSLGLLDARTGFALRTLDDRLPELIVFALDGAGVRVVRRAGPPPLAPEFVARAEAIEYPTAPGADGAARTAHAWFYPPRHPDHPASAAAAPLIVQLHGGPTGHSAPSLHLGVQFWTTRGFAVVNVNYGGSSGFGRAYRERLRGQWGVVDLHDAVAAVDYLAATGRIDPRRVAIRGGSAGGYTVLAALAFTDRFAAGINYYGIADLELLARDTHKFESRYLDSLVAPLPAGRAVYRERSPLHHLERMRGALLTVQGSDDQVVPPEQSRAIVAAARARGLFVEYLEFSGEGHGLRRAENIARAQQAELAFLCRVFGLADVAADAAAAPPPG